MHENVEIYTVDFEGILIRAYTEPEDYFFRGDPEDEDSPLLFALQHYYMENAPDTLLCKGYQTPFGDLYWFSELATPNSMDDLVEVGERIFLVDDLGRRFSDEYVYAMLSEEEIPEGWIAIPQNRDDDDDY